MIERMVDLAADELKIDPAELRRRNYIAPEAMPFKTALTFTYDTRRVREEHGHGAQARRRGGLREAPRRGEEARQARRHRPLQHHRARRRGGLRGRRDPLRQVGRGHAVLGQRHAGAGARDHLQADRVRPARHRSGQRALHAGRHRPGVPRRRHRRLALGDHRRLGLPRRGGEDRHQGEADRRASAQGRRRRREIRGGHSLQPQDQPHADHPGGRRGGDRSRQAAEGHGAGPDRHRDLHGAGAELPQRLPRLRDRDRSGYRRRPRSRATAWSTTSAP